MQEFNVISNRVFLMNDYWLVRQGLYGVAQKKTRNGIRPTIAYVEAITLSVYEATSPDKKWYQTQQIHVYYDKLKR